jgi:hypothetical protein
MELYILEKAADYLLEWRLKRCTKRIEKEKVVYRKMKERKELTGLVSQISCFLLHIKAA